MDPRALGDNTHTDTAKPSASPQTSAPPPTATQPQQTNCSNFAGRHWRHAWKNVGEADSPAALRSAARSMVHKSEKEKDLRCCRRWKDSVFLPQGLQAFITLTHSLVLSAPLPSLFSPLTSLPLRLSAKKIERRKKKKKSSASLTSRTRI